MKVLIAGDKLEFYCEGCGKTHVINTTWQFNNDVENPTFSPSVLARIDNKSTCHSFVENGYIRYLDDCSHALANQTKKLLDRSEWPKDIFVYTEL